MVLNNESKNYVIFKTNVQFLIAQKIDSAWLHNSFSNIIDCQSRFEFLDKALNLGNYSMFRGSTFFKRSTFLSREEIRWDTIKLGGRQKKSIFFVINLLFSYKIARVMSSNKKNTENLPVKLASAIFYQIFISHQMIALQKLWKMLFISSKKLFSFSIYSNFCISVFPSFSPCQPLF